MIRGMQKVDLAYVQLASSEIARDINRDVILEVVRVNQPISRAELARRSGLQRSTVSLIVDQLIEERWVREGAQMRLVERGAAVLRAKQTAGDGADD